MHHITGVSIQKRQPGRNGAADIHMIEYADDVMSDVAATRRR